MISRTLPLVCAANLILLPAATLAVQYGPQDFNRPDGTTDLGDATTIASSDGTASVQGGVLRLTDDATPNTYSSFRLPALSDSADGWTASFDFVLFDGPGNNPPADGFSLSYGAIPAFNAAQADPSAADAHGLAEEGWSPTVDHISFEVDTWKNFEAEQGFNLSINGSDIAFANQSILNDGQMIVGSVVVSWDPADGASMSVDLGLGLTSIFANVSTPGFSGNDTYGFAFSARTGGATQTLTIDNVRITTIPPGFVVLPNPVISEFMADNSTTLEDEDCRSSDWLELFNSTADPINLDGWYLTDDPAELTKWRIPGLPLAANARRVIFASGKDQTVGELHTDFAIEKAGGYLALVKPDGVTIASSYNYSQQVEDISYGTLGQAQTMGSFGNPTPGALNVAPQGDLILEKPVFSLDNQLISVPMSLELSLDPETEVPGATIRYTTNGNPPTASSTAYTSPISITTTTRVTARLFAPGKEPGPVRDRTFVKLNVNMLSARSEIPIIIIDSFGRNIDAESSSDSNNPRRPVHAIFIDTHGVPPQIRITDILPASPDTPALFAADFNGRGGMRVRGQTSAGFPKKQYAFETWDSEGNDKNVRIFGFPSESDWVIHAPYSDKTLMRNKIVYDTSHELGYPASRTRFCELYFNSNGGDVQASDYRGVYIFMEKIKRNDDRVNIKKLEACDNGTGAVTGGYIFKKDKGATNYPMNTTREGHTFSFVEPDVPTPTQRAWLDRHLDNFENILHSSRFADPRRGYASYLDVQSFIDTHIWVEVYKNIDGYRLSSYFYKDRGRKIVASPVWDYNLSLGNANYLGGEFASGWYYTQVGGGGYPWYSRLNADPEYVIQYWDRWFALRKGMLDTNAMMTRINGYNGEIRRAAVRNFNKWRNLLGNYTWPNAGGWQSRTSHSSEVIWMKDWLTNRLDWIDSQHSKPPVYSLAGGPIAAGMTLGITNPAGGGSIYYTTDGTDPRLRGGSVSPSAQPYSGSITLDSAKTIRARVRTGTNWSPVQTDSFLVGGEPAGPANLAVSEVHYRPALSNGTEEIRGYDMRTDFEFVEVMNVGQVPIDLAGVQFTGGVLFNFDLGDVRWLAPGERAVVVGNRDAFEFRYTASLSGIRIVGEYTNNLSNDGETIILSDASGADIRNFTYNDKDPWPEAADGDGLSLVLIHPMGNPDHNDPLNWRSSLTQNGTPGEGSAGSQFVGDPNGDDDQNGISNFLQYTLTPPGVDPTLPSTAIAPFTVEEVPSDFMTLSYTRNIAADDVIFTAQISEDLVNWTGDTEGVFTLVSRVENGDGTETITYRLNEPVTATAELFGRLSVQSRTP